MKRAKKILLWTGIGAGTLIAILLILAAVYSWILGRQLERKLAEIKAAGDPICLADLVRKPIPPEKNGETYLLRAKDDVNAVVNEVYLLNSCQDWRYDLEDMKKIRDTLAAYPNVYPLLQQAAACPDFDAQMDYSLAPSKLIDAICNQGNYGFLITPARYLIVRLKLSIYQGDRDEALKSAILILQLSRKAEYEPLMINYLIRKAVISRALECANKTLQSGPVSDRSRADLEAELSLHGSRDQFRQAIISERAFALDFCRREFPRIWILSNQWQLNMLNVFEKYLEISPCLPKDLASYEYGTLLESVKYFTAGRFSPAFKKETITVFYRNQAQVRSIRIINALQKKSPAEGDKIPTMAELGLPDEVGIDSFNGEPMHIKKLPEGWLVYSVGENLKDDGGDVEIISDNKPLDVGFGPKSAPAKPQVEAEEEKKK